MTSEHVDGIVVGSGLSGMRRLIAAHWGKVFVIRQARDAIGGTCLAIRALVLTDKL